MLFQEEKHLTATAWQIPKKKRYIHSHRPLGFLLAASLKGLPEAFLLKTNQFDQPYKNKTSTATQISCNLAHSHQISYNSLFRSHMTGIDTERINCVLERIALAATKQNPLSSNLLTFPPSTTAKHHHVQYYRTPLLCTGNRRKQSTAAHHLQRWSDTAASIQNSAFKKEGQCILTLFVATKTCALLKTHVFS